MILLLIVWSMQTEPNFTFTDVTESSGLIAVHGYDDLSPSEPRKFSGGAAVGDVDGDGWTDVYILIGEGGGKLFRNLGNGTFAEVTAASGLIMPDLVGCGPALVDVDGDFDLDLFVGGLEGTGPRLMRNRGDGSFEPFPDRGGFAESRDTVAAAFADIDGDGDLDAFLSHWNLERAGAAHHIWENDGFGRFTDISDRFDLAHYDEEDFSFAPHFADYDNNGSLDVLVSGDFGTSKILLAPDFRVDTRTELTDEHGMGSALGDVDNDGDLDWFVTSIWDPQPGQPRGWTGNRFYRNDGDGTFTDITTSSLRQGYWGWGAAFADFNNDGWLDLFHTNGWFGELAEDFIEDPSRFFLNDGSGGLIDKTNAVNLDDRGQGRGAICFDYDRDGDLDLLVVNGFGRSTLYRNDGGNQNNWLRVEVQANAPDTQGLHHRVYVTVNGTTQMREIMRGSNFASHSIATAHFGLGQAEAAEVTVGWQPFSEHGHFRILDQVAANQTVTVCDPGRMQTEDAPWQMLLPVTPAWTTTGEVRILSSYSEDQALTLSGFRQDGGTVAVVETNLPALGGVQMIIDMDHPLAGSSWLQLSSKAPFSAAYTANDDDRAWTVPAVRAVADSLTVPHIAAATDDFFTYAQVANVLQPGVDLNLDFPGADAVSLGELPAQGAVDFDFNPVIPDLDDTWQGYARFTAQNDSGAAYGALAGVEVFGYQQQSRLAGLSLSGKTSRRLVFAHLADPTRNWWTGLAVVNLGDAPANLTWQARTETGAIAASGIANLAPGEKRTALIDANTNGASLFTGGLPDQAAWLQIDSDQPLTGYELFGSQTGELFAGLQAHLGTDTQLVAPYAGDDQTYAALALVNGFDENQTVTFTLRDQQGTTHGQEQRTLAPNARLTLLTSDLFDELGNDRYITIQAPRGIYAFQLTGDNQSRWLTGVNALPFPIICD